MWYCLECFAGFSVTLLLLRQTLYWLRLRVLVIYLVVLCLRSGYLTATVFLPSQIHGNSLQMNDTSSVVARCRCATVWKGTGPTKNICLIQGRLTSVLET